MSVGPELAVPRPEPLADFHVLLGDPLDLGTTPRGHRRVVPIVGGSFTGTGSYAACFNGIVLPGGGDWQQVRADGAVSVEARYTLRTDGGALISIATTGIRTGPPDVLAAVARGEAVPVDAYYFRVTATFETGDPDHAWLNDVVTLASAARLATSVRHRTYVVR